MSWIARTLCLLDRCSQITVLYLVRAHPPHLRTNESERGRGLIQQIDYDSHCERSGDEIHYIWQGRGGLEDWGCSSMLFSVPLRSLAGYPSDCPTPVGFCEVRQKAQALSRNTMAQLVLLT